MRTYLLHQHDAVEHHLYGTQHEVEGELARLTREYPSDRFGTWVPRRAFRPAGEVYARVWRLREARL